MQVNGLALQRVFPAQLLRSIAAAALGACTLVATQVSAYEADIAWKPVSGAAGYKVYVGYDSDLLGTPTNVGKPQAGSDGQIHVQIGSLPVGPTGNFSVAAYVSDGSQSVRSNRMTVTYLDVASVVDSDGDGLRDAEEDFNLNERVDSGETNPKKADTDGDGVNDGDELSAGTDPLDASSTPTCGKSCSKSIWLAAGNASTFYGAMRIGTSYANGNDADPVADSLLANQIFAQSSTNSWSGDSGDKAGYKIKVPASGDWYAWGRFYYPSSGSDADANSFFLRIDSGTARKFGNNSDKFRKWHWDGDGEKVTGAGTRLSLGYISAGTHTLWVVKREVQPTPPRLDVILLTRDPYYVPSDSDARAGLSLGSQYNVAVTAEDLGDVPASGCVSDDACDDGVFCTVDRCDQATRECSNVPFDAFCDDADACNGTETCSNDSGCVDGAPLLCDDGLVCNGTETCAPREGCVSGAPPNCDDGVACTLDRCFEEAGGCRLFAFDQACDDGNACTADRCTSDGCSYGEGTGACDDGLTCTSNDTCSAGVCAGRDTCPSGSACNAESNACQVVPGDPDKDGLSGEADPCPLETRNLCAGPVAVDGGSGSDVRVNAHSGDAACGGVKIDCNGDTWNADFGYDAPVRAVVCGGDESGTCDIAGVNQLFGCTSQATEDILRCGDEIPRNEGVLTYGFDVPDGRYVVNLLFASDDGESASTRTDIVIEGRTVASDFDATQAAGAPQTAVLRSYVVDVSDGLRIELRPKGGLTAVLAGLEVLKLTK